MAVKLSPLSLSRRIPMWVSLKVHLYSSSCAFKLKPDPNQSNSTEFEAKIQFLKNKLHPDSLVSVLGTTPDLNSSMKLFKWASLQKRFTHTADTYSSMIRKLGMSGHVEEMEGFCNEMVRDKCSEFDKSLLSLINSFVSNHRFSEALRILYVMSCSSSIKPPLGTFNELMGALVEGKRDFKDVLFVYKEMMKSGIVPNIDTLNYLLEALFGSGRVDLAMDQYKRIEKKGCVPNTLSFRILISGLAVRNRVEESIIILKEMFQCECELDSSFYSCIIPIFCSLKNLEIGLRLFKMMKASGLSPDFVVYRAMIRCLCEFYHLDDAMGLFKEMVDNGLSPDHQVCLDIVNHQVCLDIVNSLCKSNRLVEAEKLLEGRNILDICSHNALLELYCDIGNFIRAKVVFDKMFEREITDARS
ncbi:hypothetical protein CASFOL_001533 [Castilleja foliolosa]|uniref:Pentatricopeptide repeat-containing protein n=1 Tax=Castilleja foliolosa TaxID=1961234 RepID=A0ABD3EJE6_9LAMI